MSWLHDHTPIPTREVNAIPVILMISVIFVPAYTSLQIVQGAASTGENEQIRVLWVGLGFEHNPSLVRDPFFKLTPVLASEFLYPMEIIRRAVRVYMPRRYEDLLEYDVLSFIYASSLAFKPEQYRWFVDAVQEEGKGLLLIGHTANIYRSHLEGWVQTPVGDVLPIHTNDICVDGKSSPGCFSTIRILENEHPLAGSLPWSSIGAYGVIAGYTPSTAKTGSETVAQLLPQGTCSRSPVPFMVGWEVGKGRSFTVLPVYIQRELTPDDPFRNWEYYPDFYSNLHLYVAGREIPQDVFLVHEVRYQINQARILRDAIISMSDFVSKLGGIPSRIDEMIGESDDQIKHVGDLYLSNRLEEALDSVSQVRAYLEEAWELSLKIKDQALLYIYLIEWAILLSTSMITGAVIWSLMVRKRLYTEVKTTKLARAGNPSSLRSRDDGE